jgi:hypothetical protein
LPALFVATDTSQPSNSAATLSSILADRAYLRFESEVRCRLDCFDHRPTELRQVAWRLPSFHSTPVHAGERCSRHSSLAVTTVKEYAHLTRVPKLIVKQFVPVEPSARHYEDDHAVLPVLAVAASRREQGLINLSRAAKC